MISMLESFRRHLGSGMHASTIYGSDKKVISPTHAL